MMVKVQKPNLMQNLMLWVGAILIIIAVVSYFKNKKQGQVGPTPEAEEIIVQEEGVVRKSDGGIQIMSEEEIQKMQQEADAVLSTAGKMVTLEDIGGIGAQGEAKEAYSDGKFYLKITANNLKQIEKGYYYEGWLKNDNFLSIGRMEVNIVGEGILYYTASVDRSDYPKVLISLEPEDGNPAPATGILEGTF